MVVCMLLLSIVTGLFMVHQEQKGKAAEAYLWKTFASLLFVFAGILASAVTPSVPSLGRELVLGGLVAGMLGDMFLSTPHISKEEHTLLFVIVGGGCFALGHLLYFISFLRLTRVQYWWPYLLVFLFLALVDLLIRSRVWKAEGILGIGFRLYGAISGLLLSGAISCVLSGDHWISLVAALLFVSSDLLLAHLQLAAKRIPRQFAYVSILLYYSAQAAFVLHLLFWP